MCDLYQGDCIDIMETLPDNKIDLTVTSPPYDNLRSYNNQKPFTFEDFKILASELFRVTKQGGVVVWVVGDATINGSETGTSFKQALYFMEVGFNLHDTMIWKKPSPIPTQSTRYQQGFEYMFIFSKGKPNTFNSLKIDSKCSGTKKKKHRAKTNGHKYNNEGVYTVSDKKMIDNVWSIVNAKNSSNHPAIFPEKLAHDHIISWSNENDLILDPFMGSGTTGKICKQLNRNFIGIELDKKYFHIAEDRINKAVRQFELFKPEKIQTEINQPELLGAV